MVNYNKHSDHDGLQVMSVYSIKHTLDIPLSFSEIHSSNTNLTFPDPLTKELPKVNMPWRPPWHYQVRSAASCIFFTDMDEL